jgi:hypothetical protein
MRQTCVLATMAFMILAATMGCSTPPAAKPDIAPQAQAALMKMSESLAKAPALNFRARTTMDVPASAEQMVQVERRSQVHFVRPDRVLIETRKDKDCWVMCHLGSSLTIMDKTTNQYACASSPRGVEHLFDELADKYGAVVPLAELLFPDPYKAMTENVLQGVYLGERDLGGVTCTHLLFVQEDVDWQIWITNGERSVPHKIVIDYKKLPGRPRFTAVLSDWSFTAPADQKLFQFCPPKDAKKVEMPALFAAQRGE